MGMRFGRFLATTIGLSMAANAAAVPVMFDSITFDSTTTVSNFPTYQNYEGILGAGIFSAGPEGDDTYNTLLTYTTTNATPYTLSKIVFTAGSDTEPGVTWVKKSTWQSEAMVKVGFNGHSDSAHMISTDDVVIPDSGFGFPLNTEFTTELGAWAEADRLIGGGTTFSFRLWESYWDGSADLLPDAEYRDITVEFWGSAQAPAPAAPLLLIGGLAILAAGRRRSGR